MKQEGYETDQAQALNQYHSTSHFLLGKFKGQPVQFLNTGCTTNLLNKQVFDKLLLSVKNLPKERDSRSLMADGTRLPFYETIRLPI